MRPSLGAPPERERTSTLLQITKNTAIVIRIDSHVLMNSHLPLFLADELFRFLTRWHLVYSVAFRSLSSCLWQGRHLCRPVLIFFLIVLLYLGELRLRLCRLAL